MINRALLTLLLASPAVAAPLVPTSKPTWTRSLGKDAGPTGLVHVGSTVVAATWESHLVGLEASTGKVRWRHKHPQQAGNHLTLAAAGGRVISGLENGNEIKGLTPKTGKTEWTRSFAGPLSSLQSCPGYRLVAVTFRGRLPDGSKGLVAQGIDPVSGKPVWQIPVSGPLAGAGAGHLFTEVPSGTGRLRKSIEAIDCATGAVRSIARPNRRFSQFIAAGQGHVATSHFEFQFRKETVCVTALADGSQQCFAATDGTVPTHRVNGGIFVDGAFLLSTAHQMAHNLDPSPDGWVFRYDLASKTVTARSAPLMSSGLFADAGTQVLTAFGTTGIDDFGYTFDPATLKPTGAIALKKAPRAVAANLTHGFVGSYDGAVSAFELPGKGRGLPAEKVVKAQPIEEGKAPDLGWQVQVVKDVHPKKARSSGSLGDGTVNDLLFLDNDSFAVGGNDDRVSVWATKSPRRVWRSPKLGKDVYNLARCRDRLAARTYGGNITIFKPRGTERWRTQARIRHGFGWAFGMAANCAIIADDFDGNFKIYRPNSSKVAAEFEAKGVFDRRWVRVTGNRMVVSRPSMLEVMNVVDLREGPSAERQIPTPTQKHGAKITQARLVRGDTLLVEYCNAEKCVVELTDGKARTQTFTFDVRGHGWSPTVGSTIEISPDGKTMVFFRRGLDMLLVDVATDRRQPLGDIEGGFPQTDSVIGAAFSPDGQWLAIRAYPKPWQVTLLNRP